MLKHILKSKSIGVLWSDQGKNMIQWLQSKIVMIVVGMILISYIIGVFHYRLDSMEEEERLNRCKKISQVITDMYNSDVDEMQQRITFDEYSKGVYLSPTIQDESYTIEIWTNLVRVRNQGGTSSRSLRKRVHLWSPNEMNNTGSLREEERVWRDRGEPYLELGAGSSDIKLTMLMLDDGTDTRPHIFISEGRSL